MQLACKSSIQILVQFIISSLHHDAVLKEKKSCFASWNQVVCEINKLSQCRQLKPVTHGKPVCCLPIVRSRTLSLSRSLALSLSLSARHLNSGLFQPQLQMCFELQSIGAKQIMIPKAQDLRHQVICVISSVILTNPLWCQSTRYQKKPPFICQNLTPIHLAPDQQNHHLTLLGKLKKGNPIFKVWKLKNNFQLYFEKKLLHFNEAEQLFGSSTAKTFRTIPNARLCLEPKSFLHEAYFNFMSLACCCT